MRFHGRKAGVARADARRGSALVLSLVAVVTVLVLSASFSQFVSTVANRQSHAVNRKRAFYLAEAGLAEAFSGFSCGKTGAVGTQESPALLGDGVFWVEATELEPDVVSLEATGMVGTGSARLRVVARRGQQGVASLGVFSSGAVTLGAGSLVDAYDSSKGAYLTQTNRSGAVLGSNAEITVNGTVLSPTTIKGDVTPGTEHLVSSVGSVTITGSTAPALASTELPAILVPEVSMESPQVHDSPYPLVIPAGSGGYESLTVQPGAQVLIQGPAEVVVGSLSLASSAELTFDTSQGPIQLYVTEALELAAGSIVTNSSARPEQVMIQVSAPGTQTVNLRASQPFHGVIYAHEAPVVVGDSFEVFGALVASALIFEGAAKLHFDRNLAKLAAEEALPVVLSWSLVELETSSADLSSDPFVLLGLDKGILPAPSEAHADQELYIDYYDFSNVYHRYVGDESRFDWNVVKSVIYATRDGVEVLFPRATTNKTGAVKSPGAVPVVDGPMV